MRPLKAITFLLFFVVIAIGCSAVSAKQGAAEQELKIIKQWSGDFPVAQLNILPEEQRHTSSGFISDSETFAAAWGSFKSGEPLPEVDFKKNLVIFYRNTVYYNMVRVFKVQNSGGFVQVMAIETMTARPVEDKAVMALVVVERQGIKAIMAGEQKIYLPGQRGAE